MNTMDALTVLKDLARRPVESLDYVTVDAAKLNDHPGDHPNSPAWLLWHAGREIDVQVSALSGKPQVWIDGGWAAKFQFTVPDDDMGFGNTPEQAREIIGDDAAPFVDYLKAVVEAQVAYLDTLTDGDLDDVIDHNWNPPVTRGARLVSVSADALEHIGQLAYVMGMPKP